MLNDTFGDFRRLKWVIGAAAPPVDPIHVEELNTHVWSL